MIEAKVCQDIILTLFAKSKFCHNITIKGGVVMRSISNNQRRSTIDIDIDFLKYPLTDNSVYELIEELNFVSDITVAIKGPIEELKHQDYQGKRAFLGIKDIYGTIISTKLDIGVNKYHSISQINHCFDVSISNEIVMLLINSK